MNSTSKYAPQLSSCYSISSSDNFAGTLGQARQALTTELRRHLKDLQYLQTAQFVLQDGSQEDATVTEPAQVGKVKLMKEVNDVGVGATLGPIGATIVGETLIGLSDHYREKTGRGLDLNMPLDIMDLPWRSEIGELADAKNIQLIADLRDRIPKA